jgi:hypothetical protein
VVGQTIDLQVFFFVVCDCMVGELLCEFGQIGDLLFYILETGGLLHEFGEYLSYCIFLWLFYRLFSH